MVDLSIQEIVPGVHAAIGGICNRGLISQGGSVLIVDSGIAVAKAAPLRAAAQERQKDGALYLFNTHLHAELMEQENLPLLEGAALLCYANLPKQALSIYEQIYEQCGEHLEYEFHSDSVGLPSRWGWWREPGQHAIAS